MPVTQIGGERLPATMAAAASAGTSTVPVELGHWLYMVSASACMFKSVPPMIGAAHER